MNIAYFCDALANHEAKWINEFAKNHQVIVICQQHVDANKTGFSNDIIQLYDLLPGVFPVYNILQTVQLKNKISEILKKHNIRIIHSMYAYPYAFYANWFYYPKIITTRGSDVLIDYNQTFKNPKTLTETISYTFYKKWFENAIKNASIVTSTSFRQQQVVRSILPDPSKSVVVRTGINTSIFQLSNQNSSISTDYIFSPRLMKPLYNIDQVLIAFSKITHQFPHLKLIQIDNAPGTEYSDEMHRLARELNLEEKIVWKPFVDVPTLIDLYSRSKVVIMIPDSDGTPNSALEAMLLKIPVIVGNVEYDSDIFNASTCWKIKNNTAESLALELIQLLNCPLDEHSVKLNNAYKVVNKKATLAAAIQTIEAIYQSFKA